MSDKPKCCAIAYDATAVFQSQAFRRCRRAGVVEREGQHYCWQHDPEREQRDLRERLEACKAAAAKRRVERAGPSLLAACKALLAANSPDELIVAHDQATAAIAEAEGVEDAD